MPYVNKPRPYKKEYKQQKSRGEHSDRMERQRARRTMDKKGADKNKNGKADLNNGIHLTETCEEWNEALTHKDFMACCDLMGNVMRNFS